jgi:hypothetical protein
MRLVCQKIPRQILIVYESIAVPRSSPLIGKAKYVIICSMSRYPIPEYLINSSDGNEWAIAAILESRVVALLYLEDIAPDAARYMDTPSAEFVIRRWAQGKPKDLLELQALGPVSVGMVTVDGFVECRKLAEWIPGGNLPEGA